MNKVRQILKKIYYSIYTTLDTIRRVTKNFIYPSFIILVYHRVDSVQEDPHLLSVTPKNFKDQILALKQTFDIVPLNELTENIKNGNFRKKMLSITFDDGYADNLLKAVPILSELNVPATIFITTGQTGSKQPFYWDKNTTNNDQGRALTEDELQLLAKNPLIHLGAHTITHPILSKISLNEQKKEIAQSKKDLEKIIMKEVISFAYPFGSSSSYDDNTIEIVKASGYTFACANNQKRVYRNSDIFALPRILVRNWSGKKLINILRKK